MGYNTPALFLNDAVQQIAGDRDLGEKIAQAMSMPAPMFRNGRIDLSVGNHGNACSILHPQHSNESYLLHLHGNLLTRSLRADGSRYDQKLGQLEAAAKLLGYKLVPDEAMPEYRRYKDDV